MEYFRFFRPFERIYFYWLAEKRKHTNKHLCMYKMVYSCAYTNAQIDLEQLQVRQTELTERKRHDQHSRPAKPMSQTEKLLIWASATLNRKIHLILLLSVLCENIHTHTYAHTPRVYSLACYNQLTKQTYWKMWCRRTFNRTITADYACAYACTIWAV